MSVLGWIISIIIAVIIFGYAENEQWAGWKKWGAIFILYIVCSNIFSSGDSGLEKAGQKYILQQLNSPSTANFLSYTSSSAVRKQVKSEWGIKLKDNCDIVMIEVEGTNGFGGRVRTTYAVFFKDGEPVDMVDADNLNKEKLIRTLSWLGF